LKDDVFALNANVKQIHGGISNIKNALFFIQPLLVKPECGLNYIEVPTDLTSLNSDIEEHLERGTACLAVKSGLILIPSSAKLN